MIFEICSDSLELTQMAAKYGAKRVELCSALSVGGLSPPSVIIEKCVQVPAIEIHTMIRLREGNFCYLPSEIEMMKEEIKHVAQLGVNGIVLGCLTPEQTIDLAALKEITEVAQSFSLEVTFHRAFDLVLDPVTALNQLIDLSIDRLLTSGLQPTAWEGVEMLQSLVQHAQQHIQIMAGSGINKDNAQSIAQTGVQALHFTSHKIIEENTFGMGATTEPDEEKIKQIMQQFV